MSRFAALCHDFSWKRLDIKTSKAVTARSAVVADDPTGAVVVAAPVALEDQGHQADAERRRTDDAHAHRDPAASAHRPIFKAAGRPEREEDEGEQSHVEADEGEYPADDGVAAQRGQVSVREWHGVLLVGVDM